MLKILFAGTPECAVPALEKTAETHIIAGILTAPPSAKGRSGTLCPSPVAVATERLKAEGKIPEDSPVFQPEKITNEVRSRIAETGAQILVCFAYGKIFSSKTLSLFPEGGINIHPSLLPKWRGPAPVPAAILAGDRETGVTIQRISLEMDAGNILDARTISLSGKETAGKLLETLSIIGAEMLPDVLHLIENKTIKETPQEGEPSFSRMLKKEDGKIDWTQSPREIDAKIRAFTPWPGAFTELPDNGGLLFIRKAGIYKEGIQQALPGTVLPPDNNILIQAGNGILAVERLQKQTKKETDWRSFLNGNKSFISSKLGNS